MIQNFLLKFSIPAWIFFILIVAAIGLTYFYYRRTIPPLPAFRRTLLTVIRGLILSIVLFLILSPVLEITSQKTDKPVLAVLLDNSASMKIQDPAGMRGDSLTYFIRELRNSLVADSFTVRMFRFARTLREWNGDSLKFQEDATDIGSALNRVVDSLSSTNLQAIVLASDGIYTRGTHPGMLAKTLPVPVYTVLIGDTSLPRDIRIVDVKAPRISYQGKEVPVEISFQQSGFTQEKTLVTIGEGKQIVARQTVTLPASGFEKKVKFSIIPQKVGTIHYKIKINPLKGEVTRLNNEKIIPIRVLKSKIKVLVISGAPDFDRLFLSFLGSRLQDFQFTFLTQDKRGGFYEQRWESVPLDSQDVFILHGFPTASTRPVYLKALFNQIRKKKPVFWIIDKNTMTSQLKTDQDLLPFQPFSKLVPIEKTMVRLITGGNMHPVTRIEEDVASNQVLWKDLPPIESFQGIRYKDGVQTLLQAQMDRNVATRTLTPYPVLAAYRAKGNKQLILAAAGVGFWYFQLQEDPLRNTLFPTFLERALRWLINREDVQQVQILPAKSIFNVGESVYFSGQVYDEFYNPVKDASVLIKITGDTLNISDEMVPEGEGYYSLQFMGLPSGVYSYEIIARRNDQQIGTRRGKFRIIPFYLEFQQVAADAGMLREIAANSGGEFYPSVQTFLRSVPQLKPRARRYLDVKEIRFNEYVYWLFILIFLLATEWFLRKRWSLL